MSGYYSRGLADKVQAAFPEAVQEIIEFRGEVTVLLDAASLIEVATFCRDTEGLEFDYLADLAGVDYWPDLPRFAVNYVLYSFTHNHLLRLKVYTADTKPTLPSVTGVWPGANWPEREVYDMFGVTFTDHPDMRRILMPYDWTGHPHRKDYPLGYEEVEFTFNIDRIEAKKPGPKRIFLPRGIDTDE